MSRGPQLGIFDVWSQQRLTTIHERILWTLVLVIAVLPALIPYVIVVKRQRRAPVFAAGTSLQQ